MTSSKRTLDRESTLLVRESDNHIQEVEFEEKDGTRDAALDGVSEDPGVSCSAGVVELERGTVQVRVQKMAAEKNHVKLGVVGESLEGQNPSRSQTSTIATLPIPLDLTIGCMNASGSRNRTPGDQVFIESVPATETEGIAAVKNHPKPHSLVNTGDALPICQLANGPEDTTGATEARQSTEDSGLVAVQNISLRSGVHLVSNNLGPEGCSGRPSCPSPADESAAVAHSFQTVVDDRIRVAEDDVSHDGRDSRYRMDGLEELHIEDEALYPVRRSRMQVDPDIVLRIVRGLAGVVRPGAIQFDRDIEMQDSATSSVGDVGGQSQGDTQSDSDGDNSESTSNTVDDSRSTSSGSSDASPASQGVSSNRRRRRGRRRHRRSNRMARFERIIRLLCLVIGGIVAIINAVLLFLPPDLYGSVIAVDHRQIAKRFSHITTLFML